MVRRISCEFHAFNQGESCPDCHAINYPHAEKPQPWGFALRIPATRETTSTEHVKDEGLRIGEPKSERLGSFVCTSQRGSQFIPSSKEDLPCPQNQWSGLTA
jgi:hypothetical protein